MEDRPALIRGPPGRDLWANVFECQWKTRKKEPFDFRTDLAEEQTLGCRGAGCAGGPEHEEGPKQPLAASSGTLNPGPLRHRW